MRIPASWLGEFVDLPEDVTIEHLHEALVKVGFEEEDIHRSEITGPVVVGQVLSLAPEAQSNGKTINWCQVDVGEAEPRGIVCGAHNFAVGDKVVVSLPGAVLPGPFPIAARKTYGHVSDGMIASARELGLGDEHNGILRLAELDLDPAVGTDALELLSLGDFAVEINVTPDRGYAFSLRGVAREYSHSTGAAFHDPALLVTPAEASGYPVTIADEAPIRGNLGVSVFTTRVVRGIDPTRPTPAWMVSRLKLAGVRSISLPVDISNYVMFELGQPSHAYDLDRITDGLVIRRSKPGETLTTLDGQVRQLDPEDLLVADGSGPIGLAGVMGGLSTEITDATTNVLVEAGIWDPTSIARSARRHKLPSEAAKRYERGVDPLMSPVAAERVVQLLVELAGGTADPVGSFWSAAKPAAPVFLADGYSSKLIGVEYTADEVRTTLELIGARVAEVSDGLSVTPPTWRPDLTDAPTLVEEVARITGYDRIPSELPVAPPGRGLTREQRLRRSASQGLASGGLTEVLTYPFLSLPTIEHYTPGQSAMKLANPLDPAASYMRTSLLAGLVETAHRNYSRGLTDLSLYEVGHVFVPADGVTYGSGPLPIGTARPSVEVLGELNASIPPQPWHIAGLFIGDAVQKQPATDATPTSLTDALDAARLAALSVGAALTAKTGRHPALHPGRTAELFVGSASVGFAGELLPALAAEANLPRVVSVFELDLDALIALAPSELAAVPIATKPAATQDLSVVVAVEVAAGDVKAAIAEGAGELLEDIRLVDDYRGHGVAEGSKSLTFALRFRAFDRTLTAEEATAAKLAGLELATERVGARLRD